MTPDERARLRAMEDGPEWEANGYRLFEANGELVAHFYDERPCELAAAARNALPRLLDALDAAEAEAARLRAALEEIAQHETGRGEYDGGDDGPYWTCNDCYAMRGIAEETLEKTPAPPPAEVAVWRTTPAAPACAVCGRGLGGESYWYQSGERVVCRDCHAKTPAHPDTGQAGATGTR